MPHAGHTSLSRNDPAVAAVVAAWRRLTGGARTLVACSGGTDSLALALALRTASRDLALACIRHDLRPREVTEPELALVRSFAGSLGLPFHTLEAPVHDRPGNAESNARTARYAALTTIARQAECPFVAVAHHADDQLETMLLALARGSSPAGLAGAAWRRPLDPGVTLVRPALAIARADTERLCADAGVRPAHDRTNEDTHRARALIRHEVVPRLRTINPAVARNAATASEHLAESAALLDALAREQLALARQSPPSVEWPRSALSPHDAVLGSALRLAASTLLGGSGMDRLSSRLITPVLRAVRDGSTEPRQFDWPKGLSVTLTAHTLRLESQNQT